MNEQIYNDLKNALTSVSDQVSQVLEQAEAAN